MIVDFSVEDNRRVPIVTQYRLVPALQIDDLQAYRAQRRFAAFEDSLLVRPAMRNRFRDALGNSLAGAPISTRKPRDSTHLALYPRFPNKNRFQRFRVRIHNPQTAHASLFNALSFGLC